MNYEAGSFQSNLLRYKKVAADFTRQFSKNKLAVVSFFIILIFAVTAIFADALYSYDFVTANQPQNAFLPPGTRAFVIDYQTDEEYEHLYILGSDNFGRDIFGRIVHGGRNSLVVGVITVFMALTIGGFLGAIAGYKGKWHDTIIMRLTDILLSIPYILLSIAIVTALGNGFFNVLLAISISQIPRYIRIVRASVLQVKDMDFIKAARSIGASDTRIILRHILSNILSPVLVQSTLNIGQAILSVSSLSFLGLGILPPTPEWGNMLSEAREFISYYPYTLFYPGIAIVLTVLAFNLIGDGLRDAFDPKLRS